MQTLLINKFDYVRSTYIPRVGTYSTQILSQGNSLMPDASQVTPVNFPVTGGISFK